MNYLESTKSTSLLILRELLLQAGTVWYEKLAECARGHVERGGGESERLWTCPECDDDDTDHKPLRSVKKHASQSLLAMAPNNKDNVFYTSHIGRGGRLSLLAS